MLNSELYFPNCPNLVRERAHCRAACWRFNASANPDLGVSATEQHRLLLQVLRPETTWSAHLSQSGYVDATGNPPDVVDVQVDQPFECTYGYNIRLGKDVHIEAGCNILDSCTVTIKARTILSPRVSIFSATHPIDPRKRNGSKGPAYAKPILIEEDCWLGGGAVVLPGISIGRGSVVGAGSVVTKVGFLCVLGVKC
jgi:acetyltransferase-like isoleucine patch superfamily enzyme